MPYWICWPAEYLVEKFPKWSEGQLSKSVRARDAQMEVPRGELSLGEHLRLGRG